MLLSSIPISSIRAFEAAARTGSFRDAANELHLTPSAVSHAIRKLESAMGTILFERSARAIRLTPAGENLMRHAGAAFDNLRRGIEEVAGRGPQLVRVHCAPSFAPNGSPRASPASWPPSPSSRSASPPAPNTPASATTISISTSSTASRGPRSRGDVTR